MALADQVRTFVDSAFAQQTEFLTELVKVPSDNPPGDCAPHAARAHEMLGALGFIVEAHKVPQKAAECADRVLASLLSESGARREEIRAWIWHAGGRDVLRALKARIGLTDEDLRLTGSVLNDHGNVSSPFVYFVLERALNENVPAGLWCVSTFGAGFSCHAALLKVG